MGWEGLGRSLEIVGLERPRGSWTGLMPRKPNQWFLGMVFLVLIPNRLSLIMNALNMLTSGPTLVALFNEGNSSAFLVKMPSGLSGLLLTRPFWQLRNLKSKFHCSCSIQQLRTNIVVCHRGETIFILPYIQFMNVSVGTLKYPWSQFFSCQILFSFLTDLPE